MESVHQTNIHTVNMLSTIDNVHLYIQTRTTHNHHFIYFEPSVQAPSVDPPTLQEMPEDEKAMKAPRPACWLQQPISFRLRHFSRQDLGLVGFRLEAGSDLLGVKSTSDSGILQSVGLEGS